jgi:hypothetical protein
MVMDVQCKPARLSNAEKALKVFDNYEVYGIEFNICDDGSAKVISVRPCSEYCWPQALPLYELPDSEEYENLDDYFNDEYEAVSEGGDDGFIQLLRELTPYLEEALTILAISNEYGGCTAKTWITTPGKSEPHTIVAGS